MKFWSARAAPCSLAVYSIASEKGEQIRKTPSKFSNIARAEVFLVYTISAKRSLHSSV